MSITDTKRVAVIDPPTVPGLRRHHTDAVAGRRRHRKPGGLSWFANRGAERHECHPGWGRKGPGGWQVTPTVAEFPPGAVWVCAGCGHSWVSEGLIKLGHICTEVVRWRRVHWWDSMLGERSDEWQN